MHGRGLILRKRAFGGAASENQLASSGACFRWGHDRSEGGPERAWRASGSPTAASRHLLPLVDHFRATDPHLRETLSKGEGLENSVNHWRASAGRKRGRTCARRARETKGTMHCPPNQRPRKVPVSKDLVACRAKLGGILWAHSPVLRTPSWILTSRVEERCSRTVGVTPYCTRGPHHPTARERGRRRCVLGCEQRRR